MELGSQISAHRTAAGLTQDELAKRVFVARQTVNNWENNKTLPDVDSLKRMAEVFGVTVDELLDSSKDELVVRAMEERHEFVRLLAINGFWSAVWFLNITTEPFVQANFAANEQMVQAISLAYTVILFICIPFMCAAAFRVNRFKDEHDLVSALDIAMYVEGRKPGSKLPNDFIYCVLLPNWTAFKILAIFVFIVLFTAMYPWP